MTDTLALIQNSIRRSRIRINPFNFLKYFFLFTSAVLVLYPLLFTFFSSFKTSQELLTSSLSFFPERFQFNNYTRAWKLANFSRYFWNSIYMTFFTVIGSIITATMAGYVFSRSVFPGKKIISAMIMSTLFISLGSLILFPQLQIARFLGINKSLWGVILIRVFGMNITQFFLARSYIDSISKEIDEAATIDGCSFFQIYRIIIFPLLKPLVASIGLLSFRMTWNDYLLPMVMTIGKPDSTPLIVGIVNLRNTGESATAWDLMLAGSALSIIPIIVVYLFLNKYFVGGLTTGAVKG